MAEHKINFRDDAQRELFEVAVLGERVRDFLLTDPVGKYLHRRAKHMIAQAEADALEVDPDGWRGWLQARRKLRVIRQQAETARCFVRWLGDAIMDGDRATEALEEDDDRPA